MKALVLAPYTGELVLESSNTLAKVIAEAFVREGYQVHILDGKNAVRKNLPVEKYDAIAFCGHGEDNALLGSDGRRLFDDENASYFSGSVVVAIACLSGKWLALTAVSKTARAYVGFNDLAVLPFSTDAHNYLGDFIRTFMVIPLALLDGYTVNQAVSEFKSLCYEYREAYDSNKYDEFAGTMSNWMDWNAGAVKYEGAPFTRLGDESLVVVSV